MRAIRFGQVIGIVVHLKGGHRHLQGAAFVQVRVTGAPVTLVVAQMQIDALAKEVIRRLAHIEGVEHALRIRRMGGFGKTILLLLHLGLVLGQCLKTIEIVN